MAITFKDVTHIYSPDMPYAYKALDHISLDIEEGKITSIIGKTGSGKSTLIQHLNALLLPSEGEVQVFDYVIKNKKNKDLKALRQKVGLVFQFPEYQLFEETILKDVAFGPQNFGVPLDEAINRAKEALGVVGLDESFYERSPLDLSGGQKRRVAIAGILAMNPDVIVLDEPIAGLDPHGAREMIKLFSTLNKKLNKTIILVCHDNEIVYRYSDNTIIMKNGKAVYQGDSKKLFLDENLRQEYHLVPPLFIAFADKLKAKGFKLDKAYDDLESLVHIICKEVKR